MAPRTTQQTKTPDVVTAVPPGAKKVTRNTREEFMEPLAETKDATEPVELEAVADGLVEDEAEDFEEAEPLSPVHKFLESLKERIGDGSGSIRIYAIRKPDPVGIVFKTPCNAEYTAGDVPYDEADLSVEALEVAIQKLYGGGRYQIKVRQNGDYAGAITRNIRDLPEQARGNHVNAQTNQQSQYAPLPAQEPARLSVRDELKDVLDLAERIATMGRNNRNNEQPAQLPQANPMDTVRDTFTLMKDLRGDMKELLGDAVQNNNGGGSGERHWSEGLLTGASRLFDSLHIGSLVEKGGELVLNALIEARKAQVLAGANGGNTGTQTNTAAPPSGSGTQPPPRELSEPQGTAAATPPSPTEAPADQTSGLSVEELQILEEVVAELRAYDALEEDDDGALLDEHTHRAAASIRKLSPATIAQLIPLPTLFLGAALSQLKPEWADIANFQDASLFIDRVKQELAKPAEEGSGELVQFPNKEKVDDKQEHPTEAATT